MKKMPSLAELFKAEVRRATMLELLALALRCDSLDEFVTKLQERLST